MELKDATYVVFDVETTGLSAVHNDLIQIAASKMHKGNIIEQFDEFIDPGHPLSAFTTELTGITDNHAVSLCLIILFQESIDRITQLQAVLFVFAHQL